MIAKNFDDPKGEYLILYRHITGECFECGEPLWWDYEKFRCSEAPMPFEHNGSGSSYCYNCEELIEEEKIQDHLEEEEF